MSSKRDAQNCPLVTVLPSPHPLLYFIMHFYPSSKALALVALIGITHHVSQVVANKPDKVCKERCSTNPHNSCGDMGQYLEIVQPTAVPRRGPFPKQGKGGYSTKEFDLQPPGRSDTHFKGRLTSDGELTLHASGPNLDRANYLFKLIEQDGTTYYYPVEGNGGCNGGKETFQRFWPLEKVAIALVPTTGKCKYQLGLQK